LPLVTTLQGELTMDASQLYERSEYARKLLREVMDESAVITGCSRKTLEDGERFYGRGFGERGRVVFNGTRLADFGEGRAYMHERPYVLAIGRMVWQKGFDVLLHAFQRVKEEGFDLILAGDGEELVRLRSLAAELGVGGKVHFLGRADRLKAVSLFLGAEFVVLPSRVDEGMPVVCAETLAAGKAMVATRVGGVPEIVTEEGTGLLVDAEDVEGLAAGMKRMMTAKDERSRYARQATQRAERFSWSEIGNEYIKVYEGLVGAGGSGVRKVSLSLASHS
jgi:glycogen synthase